MNDTRPLALALGGLLLTAVAAPVLRHRRPGAADDFPLSHYPMFSAKRRRHGRVVHVVVDDADGSHPLGYRRLGTGGFNQVRRQLTRRAATPEGAPIVIGSRTLTSQLYRRNFMLWVRYGSKFWSGPSYRALRSWSVQRRLDGAVYPHQAR